MAMQQYNARQTLRPTTDLPIRKQYSHPSTMELEYRGASSADVPAMERCRAADAESGPADPRMAAYFDGRHHPQQALAARIGFIALDGPEVVGYIAAHATTRFGCTGEVQYLYVTPDYRGSGVGRQLLRCVAEWFQENGIARVCVNADVESDGAVPFYTANGARALNTYWYVWDDIRVLAQGEVSQ